MRSDSSHRGANFPIKWIMVVGVEVFQYMHVSKEYVELDMKCALIILANDEYSLLLLSLPASTHSAS
jgi:hypothetical protein